MKNKISNKKQTFRKNIRTQQFQLYKKSRRKQLLSSIYQQDQHQQDQHHHLQHQQDYHQHDSQSNQSQTANQQTAKLLSFIHTLNLNDFYKYPNQFFQLFKDFVYSEECSKHKHKCFNILSIFNQLFVTKKKQATQKVDCFLNKSKLFFEQFSYTNETALQNLKNLLIYNCIFFVRKPQNDDKINLLLFLQLLMGIYYQISCSQQIQEPPAIQSVLLNGYDQLYSTSHNLQNSQIQKNRYSRKQYILIAQNMIEFLHQMLILTFTFSNSISYVNVLNKFICENSSNIETQFLSLSRQNLFIQKNNYSNIRLLALLTLQNISSNQADDQQRHEILSTLFRHNLLEQLGYYGEQYGLSLEQMKALSGIYSNTIQWLIQNKIEPIKIQEESLQELGPQTYQIPIQNSRGVFLNLLTVLTSQMCSNKQLMTNVARILTVIITNHCIQIPLKIQIDIDSHRNDAILSLNLNQCNQLSQVLNSFFYFLDELDQTVQFLDQLFCVLCSKFLKYMFQVSKLVRVIQILIKSYNKSIYLFQQKISKQKKQQNQFSLNLRTNQKQLQINKKKLKKILNACSQIINNFYHQTEQQKYKIDFSFDDQFLVQKVIQKIMELQINNELEQCTEQFLQFLSLAIKIKPKQLILGLRYRQQVLDILIHSQFNNHSNSVHFFIVILNQIYNFLFVKSIGYEIDFNQKNYQYLAPNQYLNKFISQWEKLLQRMEGQIYNSKTNEILSQQIIQIHQRFKKYLSQN